MPQETPDHATPNPAVILLRLMAASMVIGASAIGLLLGIAALLTGISSEEVRLIPWQAFHRVPGVAVGFVVFWTSLTIYTYRPIVAALRLPRKELAESALAPKAFRRLHVFPYWAAWTSFALWCVGALVGGFVVLDEFLPAYRAVCSICLPLLAIAINLPQIYIHKAILAPVIAYLRDEVPSLAEQEAPVRHSITEKLRVGFAATLLFALGLSLVANYLQLEWLRLKDRVEALKNVRKIFTGKLVEEQPRDGTDTERAAFHRLLEEFPISEEGGVVLIDAASGTAVLNPRKFETDEVFRLAVSDSFSRGYGEDYRRGITLVSFKTRELPGLSSLSGEYEVILAAPHAQEVTFIFRAIIIYILMLITSSAIAYVISQDLVRPLRAVLWRTRRVAEGKLNTEIPVISDDEVGDLASQSRRTIRGLHRIIGSMRSAFGNLSGAAGEIAQTTQDTSKASGAQLAETLATAKSIESLNAKIDGIVRQVTSLQETVDTTSTAGFELASTAGQLRETVRALDGEMGNIAGSTKSLDRSLEVIAKGIGNLRGAAGESRSALADINTAIAQVGAVAKDSEAHSAESLAQARQGTRSVVSTREGIERIEIAVGETAGIVRNLAEKNRKVEQILDVVNSVADQTNLLSFNAAIIAAQAGEQGQGFAVVADEIRKLADQTAASVGEIAGIVASVHRESALALSAIARGTAEVAQGRSVALDAEHALGKITGSAEASLAQASKIRGALAEESAASQVVVGLVERLQASVEDFSREEADQRKAGETIVRSLGMIQGLTRKVLLAAEEQKRASEEVSRGISDIQTTMESVLERVRQEAVEAGQIEQASGRIRALADANAQKARHLEAVSDRLQEQAAQLRAEMERFEL